MPSAHPTAETTAEVQQFYARQMRLLDERQLEEYAATFTDDGEFAHSPGRPPARTPAGITTDLVDFHRKFDDDPVQRRHWFGMVLIEPDEQTQELHTSFYALVVTTRPGGSAEVTPSCLVRDVLRRVDGELRTRSRQVIQDRALATASAPIAH